MLETHQFAQHWPCPQTIDAIPWLTSWLKARHQSAAAPLHLLRTGLLPSRPAPKLPAGICSATTRGADASEADDPVAQAFRPVLPGMLSSAFDAGQQTPEVAPLLLPQSAHPALTAVSTAWQLSAARQVRPAC